MARPRPCIRLRTETLLVDEGTPYAPCYREQQAAVIALSFDYGGVRVRADDPDERVLLAHGQGGPLAVCARDRALESQARYVLESLGAVDLACLEDCGAPPGAEADYLVRKDGDVHALVSFSAYALPQLRSLGFGVEVDPDYPYQVVKEEVPWYAHVDAESGRPDWFALELGVDVGGRRVNLLPALLELLEGLPPSARLDDLTPAGARCFALRVDEHRYVTLPPERVRLLLRGLRDLYEGDGSAQRLRFPGIRAAALSCIDAAFRPGEAAGDASLVWSAPPGLRARSRALASGAVWQPGERERAASLTPGGSWVRATLRPYQEAGVSWLLRLAEAGAGGILADDMGLGKTLQTIAFLARLKAEGRLDRPALIVAPTSVVGNWRREIERFAPDLRLLVLYGEGAERRARWAKLGRPGRCDVAVTSYTVLLRDHEQATAQPYALVVLDEAQTIKNARSQVHRAAAALEARQRLGLTGTPVENHLGELWALFDFLNPGLLGDADAFRAQFSAAIEQRRDTERMRALRDRVSPFILRRTKEEVAPELPPKTEIVRPVELQGAQRDLYESLRVAAHAEVRRAIRQKGLLASSITILDALMKLRQVCCDPRLIAGEAAREVRESAKYDLLLELVPQQLEAGRRLLVFSQFASMLALISEGLTRAGIRHVTLTGATPDRQRVVDAFEERRADVFLISLKAGGTGLNLTSADTVIHYDPWWNPAAQAQATDRAYRIGQTKPVFVHQLIVAGSVEERMLALQRSKRALAEGVLGRAPANDAGAALSEAEVDDLFAPLED